MAYPSSKTYHDGCQTGVECFENKIPVVTFPNARVPRAPGGGHLWGKKWDKMTHLSKRGVRVIVSSSNLVCLPYMLQHCCIQCFKSLRQRGVGVPAPQKPKNGLRKLKFGECIEENKWNRMAMLNYLANHMGPEPELVVAVPEWNSGSSYILEQMRCLHLCFQRCRIHFWGFQNPKMSLRPPLEGGSPWKKKKSLEEDERRWM